MGSMYPSCPPLNSDKLVIVVTLPKKNLSLYGTELEGESGPQQDPSQAFVLTEAVNGHTSA